MEGESVPVAINYDDGGKGSGRSSRMKFARRPHLDGVRAIAATLVVLFHAKMPGFENGYAGVDVFFVLSGFLITSLLIRELAGNGSIDFSKFYARRMRRLLPAAGVVLLATAIMYAWLQNEWWLLMHADSFPAAALYYENFNAVAVELDYFADGEPRTPVMHYWSLSIEEQFYMVYPLAFVVLLWFCGYNVVRAGVLILGYTFVVAVYTTNMAYGSPMTAYFSSVGRTYQLMSGAVLGLWVYWRQLRGEEGVQLVSTDELGMEGASLMDEEGEGEGRSDGEGAGGLAVELVPLVPVVCMTYIVVAETRWSAVVVGLYSCFLSTALFASLEFVAERSWWRRCLGWWPFLLLGKLSYSMYLVHMPLCVLGDLAGVLPSEEHGYVRGVVVLAVTVALAAVMWRLVEAPAMKADLSFRRAIILTGLACTVLLYVTLPMILTFSVSSETREMFNNRKTDVFGDDNDDCNAAAQFPVEVGNHTDTTEPPTSAETPSKPGTPKIGHCPGDEGCEVADELLLPLALKENPKLPPIGRDKRPKILFAGDSFTRAWAPSMESYCKSHKIQYFLERQVACAWLPVDQWYYLQYHKHKPECLHLSERILSRAQATRPDITFLFTYALWVREITYKNSEPARPGDPLFLKLVEESSRDYLRELMKVTKPVVVAPIYFPGSMNNAKACIAQFGKKRDVAKINAKCGGPRFWLPEVKGVVRIWQRLSVEMGFKMMYLDFLCPDGYCKVMDLGEFTMEDQYHLGVNYGHKLFPKFVDAMEDIGVEPLKLGCVGQTERPTLRLNSTCWVNMTEIPVP